MKIKFVCFGFENIGVEYLSACLKEKGHRTSLVFDPLLFGTYLLKIRPLEKLLDYEKSVINKIANDDFDLLAFSVMTDNYDRACVTARKVKQRRRDALILFGGVHPTSVPDIVIKEDYIDYVCVGEGEEAMVELADALQKGRDTTSIPNIWAKKDGRLYKNPPRALKKDLDDLPFPDKELFCSEFTGFNSDVYRINVGRGCNLSCSFCTNSLMKDIYGPSSYVKRRRSVDNVINELKIAKNRYPIKHILIIDDWFTDDSKWLEEFSRKYKAQIGLSFACDLYPGTSNEKAISLLEDAGCSVVSLGIQTYSEQLRSEILNRHDKNHQLVHTLQLLRKTRIFTYADFILGIPGQDEQELTDIANFINQNRVDFVFFLWLRYYPKTMITQMAHKNKWITDAELQEIESGRNCTSYFDRGSTYQAEAAKLASFLSVLFLFPQTLGGWLIKRKAYRWFPNSSFFYFRLMSIFVVFAKRLFSRKNGVFYFSVRENIKFYFHYLAGAKKLPS
jgi:radical SAM superfamily enzyme YgiQ (UPF0313 family)